MANESEVILQCNWVDASSFEQSLCDAVPPHASSVKEVNVIVPAGCFIMVDAAVRILSLANQLVHDGKDVVLDFEEGEDGTFGYLNRIGFFDHLLPEVEIRPLRPSVSAAAIYRGNSARVVEIAGICPRHQDQTLPSKLADALEEAEWHRPDHEKLGLAAFTMFSELADNIFQHSSTELDGFAVLQVYKRGVKIAVSDSGRGIISTLRPSLATEFPRLKTMSDTELIVETFNSGLSRYGRERGCGLKRSAEQAIKYHATLDVRLPTCRVRLEPSRNKYAPSLAYCYDEMPLLWGTHIVFDFTLDA